MRRKDPDIILSICPPWELVNTSGRIDTPPLELGYLAENLKHLGMSVRVYDINSDMFRSFGRKYKHLWCLRNLSQEQTNHLLRDIFHNHKKNIQRAIDKIVFTNAPLIAFIVYPSNHLFTNRITKILNTQNSAPRIICFGPGVYSPNEERINIAETNRSISFLKAGGPELNLAVELKVLKSGTEPSKTYGINPVDVHSIHPTPQIKMDLNTVAFPTYNDFNLKVYGRKHLALLWDDSDLEDGWFYKKRNYFNGYNARPVNQIIEELNYIIKNYGINSFTIKDTVVNANPEHLGNICKAIVKSGLRITWIAKAIESPSLSSNLLKKMKTAGCHTIIFRVETASDMLRKKMGKSTGIRITEEKIKQVHEAGIHAAINLLTGFPSEHTGEFQETLAFIERNQPAIHRLNRVTPLRLYPDTHLYRSASQYGIILPQKDPWDRWYIPDGNTFEVRKRRQLELIQRALDLKLAIGHPFLDEPGKPLDILAKEFKHTLKPLAQLKEISRQTRAFQDLGVPASERFSTMVFSRYFGNRGLSCRAAEHDIDILKGIDSVTDAYTGPQIVHLDLTNRCNLNCIACWDRSPFIVGGKPTPRHLNQSLPFELAAGFIDDLIELGGLQEIKLGGGGEPTVHPHFKEIISYIRSKDQNVYLDINTNFTLFDEDLCDHILQNRADRITVSLWAGNPSIYVKTHPNQSEKTFNCIVDRLKALGKRSEEKFPSISIHNVIMNLNHQDVLAMLELALAIGADEISYVLMDPVPGKTDHLLLNQKERLILVEKLNRIKPHVNPFNQYTNPETGSCIRITNFHELFRKLSQFQGRSGAYDSKIVNKIPCYIGWIFTRIMADGNVVPCCKGHRLPMGNLHNNRFKHIWLTKKYTRFRQNGLILKKSAPYFSVMGNNPTNNTGCAICDNLMHNMVVHRKILSKSGLLKLIKFELFQRKD